MTGKPTTVFSILPEKVDQRAERAEFPACVPMKVCKLRPGDKLRCSEDALDGNDELGVIVLTGTVGPEIMVRAGQRRRWKATDTEHSWWEKA